MKDLMTEYANERSGDFRDMQRVEATCRRWERDIPYLKHCSYGRYAPGFCLGRSGSGIELRKYDGSNDDFYREISVILSKRFYQPESRRKYLGALKRFLNWLNIPLNRITDKCMYAYTYDLLKNGMKPTTYSLHISALRTIFDSICDLDITSTLALPQLAHNAGSVGNCASLLSKDEIETVISYRYPARDRAFFAAIIVLNLKVNEVLNLRRKDIFYGEKTMKIWSGLGRRERMEELPDILVGYFSMRINEIEEEDYLFSRSSCSTLPLTGKGANWLLKRMLNKVGIRKNVTCKQLLMQPFEENNALKRFAPALPLKNSGKILKFNSGERVAGYLNIEIGELVRRRGIVSADIKIVVKSDMIENIVLKKVYVSELGSCGPKVKYPSMEKWDEELIWITRKERERIIDSGFRIVLSRMIISKYAEKRKSCHIRKERVYSRWRKIG